MSGLSFALARAVREVLLGADPPVRRGELMLSTVRDEAIDTVHPGGTVISRSGEDVRWWTWAGHRANATLKATLSTVTDPGQRVDDFFIRLRTDLTPRGFGRPRTPRPETACASPPPTTGHWTA